MPITKDTNPEEEQDKNFDEPNYSKIQDAIDNPIEEKHYKEYWVHIPDEPVLENLSLRQKRFCQLYALDARFMGNWAQTYMEVYDIDTDKPNWYKTVCSAASRLLGNVKVYTYINELLISEWLNDQFADKQLLYLMSQHDDKTAKTAAIKEYNKLRARIIEKVEVNNINSKLTPEELNDAILKALD